MQFEDYNIIAKIGRGGYGRVFLVRHKDTKTVYAMKLMDPEKTKSKNPFQLLKNEQEIMSEISENPWMVELHSTFHDNRYLFFVMEFLPGGDLRTLVSNVGSFSESEARFYLAEMILAVGCLHKMDFIHRDLKPDNFLVDKNGHLRLADFGLSRKGSKNVIKNAMRFLKPKTSFLQRASKKVDLNRTKSQEFMFKRKLAYSIVGSPEYMSYELLNGEGYDFTVDWWSIGVIAFELIAGFPPFTGETPSQVFQNINNYKKHLSELKLVFDQESPETFSPEAWDFISRLLCAPEQRLGHQGTTDDLLQHPFFDDFDFRNLTNMEPPFVPKLDSDDDLKYFEYSRMNDSLDELLLGFRGKQELDKSGEDLMDYVKTATPTPVRSREDEDDKSIKAASDSKPPLHKLERKRTVLTESNGITVVVSSEDSANSGDIHMSREELLSSFDYQKPRNRNRVSLEQVNTELFDHDDFHLMTPEERRRSYSVGEQNKPDLRKLLASQLVIPERKKSF